VSGTLRGILIFEDIKHNNIKHFLMVIVTVGSFVSSAYSVYGLRSPKTFRSQYALDDSFPGRFFLRST